MIFLPNRRGKFKLLGLLGDPPEAATRGVLQKKVFSEIPQNAQENTCASLFFNQVAGRNFITKETLAQVFSCEFCEHFENTFFTKHLWATASVFCL